MEVKLSDLELAKMLDFKDQETVSVDLNARSIGYMDPECMTTAKPTAASDIYSFGIVTFQVLTGREVVNLDFHARDQLIRMAKDIVKGKRAVSDFMDPQLLKELRIFDCKLLESIVHIVSLCVAIASKDRPMMNMVLQVLDKAWRIKFC